MEIAIAKAGCACATSWAGRSWLRAALGVVVQLVLLQGSQLQINATDAVTLHQTCVHLCPMSFQTAGICEHLLAEEHVNGAGCKIMVSCFSDPHGKMKPFKTQMQSMFS